MKLFKRESLAGSSAAGNQTCRWPGRVCGAAMFVAAVRLRGAFVTPPGVVARIDSYYY